jgi:hypothetical protein
MSMTRMTGTTRAVLTLVAGLAAGVLVWLATQFDFDANPGFWGAMAVLAGAGVLLGLAQLGRDDGDPAAMALVAFLPVALLAGWVLVAVQPEANELGDRVTGWSADLGIDGLVESLGTFAGVLAFGAGVVLGLTLAEAFSRATELEHERRPLPAGHEPVDEEAAYEPTAAERRAAEAEAEAEAAEREAAGARLAAEQERMRR